MTKSQRRQNRAGSKQRSLAARKDARATPYFGQNNQRLFVERVVAIVWTRRRVRRKKLIEQKLKKPSLFIGEKGFSSISMLFELRVQFAHVREGSQI